MGRGFRLIALSCLLFSFQIFLHDHETSAYTPTVTPNGLPVRWARLPQLNLAGNPASQSGLGEADVFSAVVKGLQRWSMASGGTVKFDYWQGTDPSVYEPNSDFNGLSSIYFISNGKGKTHLTPNILGLTQVWYNTQSGEILETDIILNDRDFQFTTDPTDTSGYGSGNEGYSGAQNRVFIENVITHELGHAFGLSHTGGLQATMLFMESPEQAYLSCDEEVAIRALYGTSDSNARTTITGSVISEAGKPVFGAHVLAISRRRGAVISSGLTDRNGEYIISALEPGEYFLIAEPFLAGPQALPAYYSSVNSAICPGPAPFGRTPLTEGDGLRLAPVKGVAGGNAVAPPITARCGNRGGAAFSASSLSPGLSTAPEIFNGLVEGQGFGIVDRFESSSTLYYRLRTVTGDLEVHALAYSLYSPEAPSLSLLTESGFPVPAKQIDRVYIGASGYVNYDSALTIDDLPSGDYLVKVQRSLLYATMYPAGPALLDSVSFLVVTGSVNEEPPPLQDVLPFNARCRMVEEFPPYHSPPGNPPRGSGSQEGEDGGFCGTTKKKSDPMHPGTGPGTGAIAGWFLPWVLMLLIAMGFRRGQHLAPRRS